MKRNEIVMLIERERMAQLKKWGDQSGHSELFWHAIISEELGEIAKKIIEHIETPCGISGDQLHMGSLKVEIVQVAACCFAWLEEGFED